MGHAEVRIALLPGQRLPYASRVFAQRRDAPANSGAMLTEMKSEALDEGGVDGPAAHREPLVPRLQRPEHDPVPPADEAPAPHGLHSLGIEELRERHPARRRRGTSGLAARRVLPAPRGGQQNRQASNSWDIGS